MIQTQLNFMRFQQSCVMHFSQATSKTLRIFFRTYRTHNISLGIRPINPQSNEKPSGPTCPGWSPTWPQQICFIQPSAILNVFLLKYSNMNSPYIVYGCQLLICCFVYDTDRIINIIYIIYIYILQNSCFLFWCWSCFDAMNGFNGDIGQDLVDLSWVTTRLPLLPTYLTQILLYIIIYI